MGKCDVKLWGALVLVALHYAAAAAIFSLWWQGIGEPPLLLSCAVFYAVRSAIKAARHDAGLTSEFDFDSPATVGRILRACCMPWLIVDL